MKKLNVSWVLCLLLFVLAFGGGAVYGNLTKFPDVKSGFYYEGAINKFSDLKIITGYEDGNFGPDDALTRGQIAVILDRYDKYLEKKYVAKEVVQAQGAGEDVAVGEDVEKVYISKRSAANAAKNSSIVKKIIEGNAKFLEQANIEVSKKHYALERNLGLVAYNDSIEKYFEANEGKEVYLVNLICFDSEVCQKSLEDNVPVPKKLNVDTVISDNPVDVRKVVFVIDAESGDVILFEYALGAPMGDAEAYWEFWEAVE